MVMMAYLSICRFFLLEPFCIVIPTLAPLSFCHAYLSHATLQFEQPSIMAADGLGNSNTSVNTYFPLSS
jgi:hypothetical protein